MSGYGRLCWTPYAVMDVMSSRSDFHEVCDFLEAFVWGFPAIFGIFLNLKDPKKIIILQWARLASNAKCVRMTVAIH